MIQGHFGEQSELFFELDLIASDGSVITVEALLDTGFTDWVVMNSQDADSLGWSFERTRAMAMVRGTADFLVYMGTLAF